MSIERRIVGPFNRVEGDLEVQLDIHDSRVQAARVSASLYRGFEEMLPGRPAEDALVVVPRVCGICSVAQSIAAATALRWLAGMEPARNGQLAECLTAACENLADHLTHFYLFFMPDLARPAYAGRPWYPAVAARFRALHGEAANDCLPARAAFMHLMGILAGKWPHTLSLRPGGSSRPLARADILQAVAVLRDFRRFLESRLFGDRLETVAQLASVADLERWRGQGGGDLRGFLAVAEDLGLDRIGRATDTFLSYGAYAGPDGRLWPAGLWQDGRVRPLEVEAISEDVSHAWLDGGPLPPGLGQTHPNADKAAAYTWCKAPRYGDAVVETGALARQMVAGHPLVRAWVAERGASVTARVLARMLELAIVVPVMETWLRAVEPGAPWCVEAGLPADGEAVGLTEAARGSLGHWLTVRQGRIARYQIVAPTTWNFSPRDSAGTPGALEQALAGMAVPDGDLTVVQHVVRSFDPCMACTVH